MSLTPAQTLIAANRVLLIAHRGDSGAAPENTLPAFQSAIKVGVDGIELDYQHTSDGVPVVFHDLELDRVTDAPLLWNTHKIKLADRLFVELRQLDAGRWYNGRFTGALIPALTEALDLIQSGSTAIIERKTGDAVTLIQLLAEKQLLEQVVVMAFDWSFLEHCHKLAHALSLVALGEGFLDEEKLDTIHRSGAKVVGWNNRWVTPEVIAAIHARHMRCWVWTVDSVARAQELIAWGVNGIITNQPAAIKPLLAAAD